MYVHAQLDRFVEVGDGTLIGASTKLPAEVPDHVVLATKGRFPMGSGPNDVGVSRRHLARALEASRRGGWVSTAST